MVNLDFLAAKCAQSMLGPFDDPKGWDDVENLVTKALGVVQENGLYAGMLFLLTRTRRKDREIAAKVRPPLVAFASEIIEAAAPDMEQAAKVLDFVAAQLCQDLDRMILVKQAWEQALIYARFGAKARKPPKQSTGGEH